MRDQLEKLIGVKASLRRDEDIVQSMGNIVKEKEALIDKLRAEVTQAAVSLNFLTNVLCRQERKNLET